MKTAIERNITNIREEDLDKFAELAFTKKYEGNEFASGFDLALQYLSGRCDFDDVREHLK